jgi:hypothetical protein
MRKHFEVYLEQIPILVSVNADWALLHYIIIFPDICGALEDQNGQSSKTAYINWANRYVGDNILTGEEWYDIRCRILHQGITAGKLRYAKYLFKSPGVTAITHKSTQPDGSIVLDVHEMKDELLSGLNRWFSDVENKQKNSENVILNIPSIAGIVTVTGTNSTTVASIQLSSVMVSGTASPKIL